MKPVALLIAAFVACATAKAADSAAISIPSISALPAIDGRLEDPGWQGARSLALTSTDFGPPFPAGGETHIAVCGDYLCVSAQIPEPDCVVAHSTGRNPTWWSEDLVTWTFRGHSAKLGRNWNVSLSVNPLGTYRFQNSATTEPLQGSEPILVAGNISGNAWTVEAAIPLDGLAEFGFLGIERIRARRPDTPELHWYWPAPHEQSAFQLAPKSGGGRPAFHPAALSVPSPDHPKSELDWIPGNAWTAEQQTQLRVSQMLENAQRARISAVAEQEKKAWQQVDSRESWERFRDARLAALVKWMGPLPQRTPLGAVVTRRLSYGDGFAIENLVFESRPHLLVTANLYLPENLSEKIPAIIVVHSHHAPKVQSELQDLGMTWARSGTAVLVMDQLCAGERIQSQPWPRESYYARYALGNQLLLAGESLMKWMVWDLMRGVDLLLERPYIDRRRIIMLGAVAGGGDPAAVAAALDPRIAAVIPFNFGEAGPEEHYTEGPRGYPFDTAWPGWGEWETTRCLPRSIADQFFPWFLCASVAPRPFLYSFEIGWPVDVEHEPAWARYKKVFELYGARDHLDDVHGFGPFPGPGECTNVGVFLRKRIYPILTRWLGVPTPAAEYHNPRPDSELMCLTPAVAAERRPKTASAIARALAQQRLDASPFKGRLGDLRAALQEKLGDIEPLANPTIHPLWSRSGAQAAIEAFAIQVEPGIQLPVFLLKPPGAGGKRTPAVLALAQNGKRWFLSHRGGEILTLLRNGIAVCLPDLRDAGELAATQSRGPGAMTLAVNELMLGNTLLGSRLKDVRTIFRYLASRPDLNPERIAIWGDSPAETNPDDFILDQSDMQEPGPFPQHQAEPMGALLALLAGLYEDRVSAIAARGGLVSFASALDGRFCHVPQDILVPGILEIADVPDIVAISRSRPVLLEGFVDGRNRLARAARLQSEFGAALQRSRQLLVREKSGDPELASWLARQCIGNESRKGGQS